MINFFYWKPSRVLIMAQPPWRPCGSAWSPSLPPVAGAASETQPEPEGRPKHGPEAGKLTGPCGD